MSKKKKKKDKQVVKYQTNTGESMLEFAIEMCATMNMRKGVSNPYRNAISKSEVAIYERMYRNAYQGIMQNTDLFRLFNRLREAGLNETQAICAVFGAFALYRNGYSIEVIKAYILSRYSVRVSDELLEIFTFGK